MLSEESQKQLAGLRRDLSVMTAVLGLIMVGVAALVLKAFL